jgi:hypothetical protein
VITVPENKTALLRIGADERGPERIGTSPESEKQKPIFPLRTLRPLRLKSLLFNFHFSAILAILSFVFLRVLCG